MFIGSCKCSCYWLGNIYLCCGLGGREGLRLGWYLGGLGVKRESNANGLLRLGYRYYEGGVSSVYFWDLDDGFAGVVLLKKSK